MVKQDTLCDKISQSVSVETLKEWYMVNKELPVGQVVCLWPVTLKKQNTFFNCWEDCFKFITNYSSKQVIAATDIIFFYKLYENNKETFTPSFYDLKAVDTMGNYSK